MSAAAEEPVGSAAEEAARLVDALQGWFGARAEATTDEATTDEPPRPATEGPEAPREHGPACLVCRGLAYVQQVHPDVVDHLAAAAQHVAAALHALATPPESHGATESGSGPARPTGRAVRIDVEPDPHLPNCGPSEQEPEP